MKESIKYTKTKAQRRARRVRARIHGTPTRPRMSVHLSARHLSAQFIDDEAGRTLLAVHDRMLGQQFSHLTKEAAAKLGRIASAHAREKGIETVVFDRGSRAYHGRVKAFAEGAREGGLIF